VLKAAALAVLCLGPLGRRDGRRPQPLWNLDGTRLRSGRARRWSGAAGSPPRCEPRPSRVAAVAPRRGDCAIPAPSTTKGRTHAGHRAAPRPHRGGAASGSALVKRSAYPTPEGGVLSPVPADRLAPREPIRQIHASSPAGAGRRLGVGGVDGNVSSATHLRPVGPAIHGHHVDGERDTRGQQLASATAAARAPGFYRHPVRGMASLN